MAEFSCAAAKDLILTPAKNNGLHTRTLPLNHSLMSGEAPPRLHKKRPISQCFFGVNPKRRVKVSNDHDHRGMEALNIVHFLKHSKLSTRKFVMPCGCRQSHKGEMWNLRSSYYGWNCLCCDLFAQGIEEEIERILYSVNQIWCGLHSSNENLTVVCPSSKVVGNRVCVSNLVSRARFSLNRCEGLSWRQNRGTVS